MNITVDPQVADAAFVYFALRSEETVDRLRSHALVAGVPHINLGILREFVLRVPDPATQRRVSAVLNVLDDLIAINERRIELLEELARSIYREWFVRFRFPGYEDADAIESEIGPVPSEWDLTTLGAMATWSSGWNS